MGAITGMMQGANSANAASEAGNTQLSREMQGLGIMQGVYDKNSANYNPYIQGGQQALSQLQAGVAPGGALSRDFTQADFYKQPGYQFDVNQGMQAISNANSVRGGALSGGTQKSMVNFGEQQASNAYQGALQNFQQNQSRNYQMLSGLAGQGLQATQGLGSLGNAYGQAAMGQYNNMGTTQASAILGRAQGENQALGAVGSSMGGSNNGGMGMLGSIFGS